MNKSNNLYDGSVQSHIKISKRQDGKFEATSPNAPDIPPVVSASESGAILSLKSKIAQALRQGGK